MGYCDFYILDHSKMRWDWGYFEPRICRIFSNIVMLVVLLNFWETLKLKCSLRLCSGTKQKQKCQIRSRHGIISWNDLDEDRIPFSRKVHKSIHQSGCFCANATFHWFLKEGGRWGSLFKRSYVSGLRVAILGMVRIGNPYNGYMNPLWGSWPSATIGISESFCTPAHINVRCNYLPPTLPMFHSVFHWESSLASSQPPLQCRGFFILSQKWCW